MPFSRRSCRNASGQKARLSDREPGFRWCLTGYAELIVSYGIALAYGYGEPLLAEQQRHRRAQSGVLLCLDFDLAT